MSGLKQQILEVGRALGFDAVGVAEASSGRYSYHLDEWLKAGMHAGMDWMMRQSERRKDIRQLMPEVRSVVMGLLNYYVDVSLATTISVADRGVVARYARGRDYHKVMEKSLRELGRAIERLGGPGTQVRCSVDTSAVMEREWIERAGLAWIGKSTMALNRDFGTWFLIGEVITNLSLEQDPETPNRCGSCVRCIEACPTQAIVAPYTLDARRCISYLTIESKEDIPEIYRCAVGNRIFGCDDCLQVCPWNRFAQEAKKFKEGYREDLVSLDPREILRMSEAQFFERFSGTPLRRLGWERLQRNACVVLGNIGTAGDQSQLRKISETHPSSMVRRHASWALCQLSSRQISEEGVEV